MQIYALHVGVRVSDELVVPRSRVAAVRVARVSARHLRRPVALAALEPGVHRARVADRRLGHHVATGWSQRSARGHHRPARRLVRAVVGRAGRPAAAQVVHGAVGCRHGPAVRGGGGDPLDRGEVPGRAVVVVVVVVGLLRVGLKSLENCIW